MPCAMVRQGVLSAPQVSLSTPDAADTYTGDLHSASATN
jgi:hypothetical protein